MAHRILIVDDDPSILRSAARRIERMGYDTLKAGSVEEAFKILDVQKIDTVLTDLEMPDKNGEDLAREAREWWPDVKIFLHSGRPELADKSLFDAIIDKGNFKQLKEAIGGAS